MGTDERRTLERIWSVHEIRQLAYRYAYAFDSRDVRMLASLWEETAEPAAYPEIDIHTIRGDFDQWLVGMGPTVLSVTNHIIDFDGDDEARGVVYCLAQIDMGDRYVEQSVLYQDRYARRGHGWRFVTRRHMLWFGRQRDDNPFRQPDANWPASPIGRGTLPDELPAYQRFRDAAG